MKGKKIRIGKYKVRICINCGTEIGGLQIKYCIKCARKHWRMENNRLNIHKYWQKKEIQT